MAEFGTSREIITRILKDFYASGMISASRGVSKLLDVDTLKTLSIV